jgi:UDP-N-acetylglucosamine--N-acetylmuramyl-(pentapeptide) pyrophosphoryl-undecaprenol N-acetylglucosamine transferase
VKSKEKIFFMKILIAGGGTGGHLFPGIALAEELVSRAMNHKVLFVGTQHGLEAKHVPQAGFDLEKIEIGGLKGRGLWGWIMGLMRLPRAVWQSTRIIRRFHPDVVVGVGGYASGPVVLAAWLVRTRTLVLEQNALPGMTNKILGKLAKRVVVAFQEAKKYFPRHKVVLLGNPVRKALLENFLRRHQPKEGIDLLVFGGSQGARTLNKIVPVAVGLMAEEIDPLRVVHQTGERELEQVVRRYKSLGVSSDVQVTAFIDDMAGAYRRADLVVCRAGATTVTELSLCRIPSVLIPFPYAADNHQEINAQALVNAGAAVMVRESQIDGEKLALIVMDILKDKNKRMQMENAAASVSRPEAAQDVADLCLELAKRKEEPI